MLAFHTQQRLGPSLGQSTQTHKETALAADASSCRKASGTHLLSSVSSKGCTVCATAAADGSAAHDADGV